MYKVIKHFTDLQDKNYPYNVGDVYPREGHKVTEERLAELAGNENKQGVPLIELVEEPKAVSTERAAAKATAKKPAAKKTAAKSTVK